MEHDAVEKNKKSRASYQRKYYLRNKDKRSDSRKDRYWNDPEYRENAVRRARMYRVLKAKERSENRSASDGEPKKQRIIRESVDFDGSTVLAYSIGEISRRTGVPVSVLGYLVKHRTIPESPFRSKTGKVRLYTDDMILVVEWAISKYGIARKRERASFSNEIRMGWEGFGYSVPAFSSIDVVNRIAKSSNEEKTEGKV